MSFRDSLSSHSIQIWHQRHLCLIECIVTDGKPDGNFSTHNSLRWDPTFFMHYSQIREFRLLVFHCMSCITCTFMCLFYITLYLSFYIFQLQSIFLKIFPFQKHVHKSDFTVLFLSIFWRVLLSGLFIHHLLDFNYLLYQFVTVNFNLQYIFFKLWVFCPLHQLLHSQNFSV